MKHLKIKNITISLIILTTLALSGCRVLLPDNKPPIEGNPAPNFSLKDGQGERHTLKDYLGKVVLLEFWASY
ncbi:MAG: Thiol-disulfide oxidoreductase ResA [candidate division WS2 bacterium]|uniref:Thiol-disulfide oxidoreductase ResA n=1 Tax=Psychracetigena formicireducens TaxID=2986056 RepID=A0A9E2BGM0_PSYF1|nr:Thiol-disulfide oxidoreductase ResA [Candidatus Psychracetigena formicireducens]MBT9144532.1 Thiol-disulfide oxidoreductase ResA [Candidatus Psychracetigena formicireducens]